MAVAEVMSTFICFITPNYQEDADVSKHNPNISDHPKSGSC